MDRKIPVQAFNAVAGYGQEAVNFMDFTIEQFACTGNHTGCLAIEQGDHLRIAVRVCLGIAPLVSAEQPITEEALPFVHGFNR